MPNFALTIVLALLTMVGPLGIDAYLPSFPAIAAEFGVSPLIVQQTLSFYVGGLSVMMLFYGTLSDSFGRRPVMMASLILFALTSVAAALATSIGALILIRCLQGLCAGAGMVIARAIVQDRFRGAEAQRMMAMITMVFGVAPALAPIVGGWLQTLLGWRSIFVFLALFGAAMWYVSRKVLDESLPLEHRTPFKVRSIAANYRQVLGNPGFLMMTLGISMVFCIMPLYVGSAAAFVIDILHQPETAFGWLFIPLVSGIMIGSAVASRYAHRIAPHKMIRLGFVIMVASALISVIYAAFFVVTLPFAVLPFSVYTFGLALASPSMTVSTLSIFPQMRGMAASMQGFIQMMTFALISGLVAPLLFDSALKLAFGLAVGLVAGIAFWGAGAQWRQPAASQGERG